RHAVPRVRGRAESVGAQMGHLGGGLERRTRGQVSSPHLRTPKARGFDNGRNRGGARARTEAGAGTNPSLPARTTVAHLRQEPKTPFSWSRGGGRLWSSRHGIATHS